MSDLNDDILTYELGDDIDDQALLGADEDELLLSDEDLEKDVTKEVKQQLKADAEQWVKAQIKEKQEKDEINHTNGNKKCATSTEKSPEKTETKNEISHDTSETSEENNTLAVELNTVTSSTTCKEESTSSISNIQTNASKDISELPQEQVINDVYNKSIPISQVLHESNVQEVVQEDTSQPTASQFTYEIPSSSIKEKDIENLSAISCSTNTTIDNVSFMPSSQESASAVISSSCVSTYIDPREDYEEREVRTNIKITNEREVESVDPSNEKQLLQQQARFVHGKRMGNIQHRPQGMRPIIYATSRPLLRFPHGQFPQHGTHNPFAPHATQPQPQAPQNALLPQPQHDPMHHNQMNQQMRQPFPLFRPGVNANMGFRHPNTVNMYSQVPHEFGPGNTHPQQQFNPNFANPPRGMFRPENPNLAMMSGMRPGMQRMQRPPLQALGSHQMAPNFINNTGIRPQLHPQHSQHQQQVQVQQQKQHPQPQHQPLSGLRLQIPPTSNTATIPMSSLPGTNGGKVPSQMPIGGITRPSKVLINPNFKGGVEAATNKFIQDTQFMSTISSHVSHLQSDDELLRQQEEFINKNREHIEKRIHYRSPTRRIHSRSRSRSRTRERTFSPPKRPYDRNIIDRIDRDRNDRFERRDRERDRDRERERERDHDRERDRPIVRDNTGGCGGNNNRMGRYRSSGQNNNNNNYVKRRRSISPNRGNTGASGNRNRERERDRGNDKDNNLEEDEEARAYRLGIERQKALREKILRDKELKRRRAIEEKIHDDKREEPNNKQIIQHCDEQPAHQNSQMQKLTPIVVTERKIITLKKQQQPKEKYEGDDKQHGEQQQNYNNQHQQHRKQIPTAKILPEAKRTLNEHLSNVSSSSGGGSNGNTGSSGGGGSSGYTNTAIIKPVIKKDHSNASSNTAMHSPKHAVQRLSTPSDDEVMLDYDEDELMLDEEDRLLATPSPSPPPTTSQHKQQHQYQHQHQQSHQPSRKHKQQPHSRTPTPEAYNHKSSFNRKGGATAAGSNSTNNNNSNISTGNSVRLKKSTNVFTSSNRRVVLQSTASTSSINSSSAVTGRNRRDAYDRNSGGGTGSGSNSRKAIFERLDLRRQQQQQAAERSNHDDVGKQPYKRGRK